MDNVKESILAAIIACTECHAPLILRPSAAACESCGALFPRERGAIIMREGSREYYTSVRASESDRVIVQLKSAIKRPPRLAAVACALSGVFVGVRARHAIAHLRVGARIINIGSGTKTVRHDVIGVDAHPFAGVDIVADAYSLPIQSNSCDALIAESLLEHVQEPERVVAEILRVLAPGGLCYIVTPFMLGYHASPHDYHRWTLYGLRELLRDFDEVKAGVAWGPSVAVASVAGSWLSMLLSFGSTNLFQLWSVFFLFLLAPIGVLDYILCMFPFAEKTAHGFYIIVRKPLET